MKGESRMKTTIARYASSRILQVSAIIVLTVVCSGCLLLNDVSPVSINTFERLTPKSGRALVIYGIGIEGRWSFPDLTVALDEYDARNQSITGNCWRFNRMEASITAIVGTRQYFMFDVQPGHYVYSGFNSAQARKTWAFEVPVGRAVYLGDFVYVEDGTVDLRRYLASARSYLKEETLLANVSPVPPPKLLLCAP